MCGKDRRPFCRRPVQLEFLATTDVGATTSEEEMREEGGGEEEEADGRGRVGERKGREGEAGNQSLGFPQHPVHV